MISTFTKSYLALAIIIVMTAASWVYAAVEIDIQKTLKTEGTPLDVVITPDGSMTFVLTDKGNVLIYDRFGNLTDTVRVGPHVDQIEISPTGEQLFAASRQNKTIDIISLSFIHKIITQGAPAKGPQEAPVVIAVFSDFQ